MYLGGTQDLITAASDEQEPRSNTGRPESQPKKLFVCSWHVACVRSLICRTMAAALLKRPDLRHSCPGAWIQPLAHYVEHVD
eukprot:4603611-Amphidinium_carterae.2